MVFVNFLMGNGIAGWRYLTVNYPAPFGYEVCVVLLLEQNTGIQVVSKKIEVYHFNFAKLVIIIVRKVFQLT